MTNSRRKGRKHRKSPQKSSKLKQKVQEEFSPDSLDHLQAAVTDNPEDILARLELGEYYLRNDLEDKILDTIADLEKRYPFADQFLRGYYNRLLAFGYAHCRQFIEAEKAARRGLKEYPDSLDFYFVLAYLHLSLRELDETITASEKFVSLWNKIKQGKLPPMDFTFTGRHITQLFNILGSAYREKGDVSKACRYYEQSIEADPGHHLPYINLSTLLRQTGEQQQADEILKRGLARCRQAQELRLLARSQEQSASVSACMIVKNEEEFLPDCLDSIRDWVDEIIIVDTGSTDRTIEIARSYGARVFHQPWEGNFSKHRNHSIDQATCDWIFIIDADERIYEQDVPQIKKVLNQDRCHIVSINVYNVSGQNEETVTFLPSIRFFRRELGLRYEGIVHNLLLPPADQPVMRAGIRLKHYGYGLSPDKMKAKIARSKALLEKQISENPDNAFALFNYAQLLRGEGVEDNRENASKIIEFASRALKLTNPDDARERHIHIMTHHQLGWVYFVLGDYGKAEKYCLDVLQFKPNYLDALLLLGHIYLRQELFDQAEQHYWKYIEAQAKYNETCEIDNIILLHPSSLRMAYYGLGLVAEHAGEPEQARRHYRKTFDLSPDYMDICIRLGRLYLSEHNYEDARRCFSKRLELDEKSDQALVGLADLYFLEHDFEKADHHYRSALGVNSEDGMTLAKYGHFLLETGQESRGIEMLEKAAAATGLNDTTARHVADTCFQHGRYGEAAEVYRRLLQTETSPGGLLNDLGNCLYKLGDYEEAEKMYQQVLEAPEPPASVYRNLGLARAKLNKLKEAIVALDKYAELEPDHHEKHQTIHIIGDLYSKLGEYNSAIANYETFLRNFPQDTRALFCLSECYLHMGHRDSAILGYQRVLQLDSRFEPARRRLTELAEPVGRA